MTAQREPERARFYTSTRRIPLVFGKLPEGGRIPGGPYTAWQVLALFVTLPVAWFTCIGLGMTSVIAAALTSVLVALGAMYGAAYIPNDIRNPFSVVSEAFAAIAAPGRGRLGTRTVVLTPAGSIPWNARRSVAAARALLSGSRAFEAAAQTTTDWEPLPTTHVPVAVEPTVSPAAPAALPSTGVARLRAIAQSREVDH